MKVLSMLAAAILLNSLLPWLRKIRLHCKKVHVFLEWKMCAYEKYCCEAREDMSWLVAIDLRKDTHPEKNGLKWNEGSPVLLWRGRILTDLSTAPNLTLPFEFIRKTNLKIFPRSQLTFNISSSSYWISRSRSIIRTGFVKTIHIHFIVPLRWFLVFKKASLWVIFMNYIRKRSIFLFFWQNMPENLGRSTVVARSLNTIFGEFFLGLRKIASVNFLYVWECRASVFSSIVEFPRINIAYEWIKGPRALWNWRMELLIFRKFVQFPVILQEVENRTRILLEIEKKEGPIFWMPITICQNNNVETI